MRILIDECLSPALVTVANGAGFEAYHVAHRGWAGYSDRQLLREMLRGDFVLVTNNRDDFLELIEGVELHSGLIVFLDKYQTLGSARPVRDRVKRSNGVAVNDQSGD